MLQRNGSASGPPCWPACRATTPPRPSSSAARCCSPPNVPGSLNWKPTSRARSNPASSSVKPWQRSEEHTSELQSPCNLVCRLLLEKKKTAKSHQHLRANEIDCIAPSSSNPLLQGRD